MFSPGVLSSSRESIDQTRRTETVLFCQRDATTWLRSLRPLPLPDATRRDSLSTLLALGSSSALCCPLSLHFAYLLICICESQSSHVLCSPSTISCLCPSILPAVTIDVRTNDAPIDDFSSFFLEILRLLLTSSSAMVASYFSFNLL